jgi:hypothetical protein
MFMCNAWNHPRNCHCGWGGDGHLGRGGPSGPVSDGPRLFSTLVKARYLEEAKGYTTPNALCPVCRAPTFFYQSSEGGRVFFDALGPPWPKHPCTDVASAPNVHLQSGPTRVRPGNNLPAKPSSYPWQRGSWTPFICESRNLVQPSGICVALTGLLDGLRVVLFVLEKGLVVRAPYQVKKFDETSLTLSTVQLIDGAFVTLNVRAFKNLSDILTATRLTMSGSVLGSQSLGVAKVTQASRPHSGRSTGDATLNSGPLEKLAGAPGEKASKPRPINQRSRKRSELPPPNVPKPLPPVRGKPAMHYAFEKFFGIDVEK